jgi:hypothetical protein
MDSGETRPAKAGRVFLFLLALLASGAVQADPFPITVVPQRDVLPGAGVSGFAFDAMGGRVTLTVNGDGTFTRGGKTTAFRLNLRGNTMDDRPLAWAAYRSDLILFYALFDGEEVEPITERLDGTTLASLWQRNGERPLVIQAAEVEDGAVFLAGPGAICRLTLEDGRRSWSLFLGDPCGPDDSVRMDVGPRRLVLQRRTDNALCLDVDKRTGGQ